MIQNQNGQGLIEYTLMVLLVALVMWVAVKDVNVAEKLESSWLSVKTCVETPTLCGK